MKYLLISFFLISLASCGIQTTKGLLQQKTTKKSVVNGYFANQELDYVYKAKVDINGNKFGGILIIKKTNQDQHRVVFTTEFGNKIFDFEYDKDAFEVIYILDRIDKKIILNALRKNFHLLVNESNLIEKEYLSNGGVIYQTKRNRKHNYLYVFDENSVLKRLVLASKNKEKLIIDFDKIEKEIAHSITMINQNFKMNIDLVFINKQ